MWSKVRIGGKWYDTWHGYLMRETPPWPKRLWRKRPQLTLYRSRRRTMPTFALLHAGERGWPVLREDASWRTVCGFALNTRAGCAVFQFRRVFR